MAHFADNWTDEPETDNSTASSESGANLLVLGIAGTAAFAVLAAGAVVQARQRRPKVVIVAPRTLSTVPKKEAAGEQEGDE